jgi:hypothetical protein
MHVTGWIPLVGSDVPAGQCVQDSLQREPLASHHHPLWAAAVDMEKDERGKKTKRPLYSRCTTSTVLRVDGTFGST